MQRFFITGTDTDCGKTVITCELLDYLNKKSLRSQALKPIASGYTTLLESDIGRISQCNVLPDQIINKWCYNEPIAPHIAAQWQGDIITAHALKNFCTEPQFNQFDYLLIEGAGGLMVPLNPSETWIDFIQALECKVILVVAIKLGCINHALLSDAVLTALKLPYAGWIANFINPESAVDDEIIELLRIKMHQPLIASMPYYGKINLFSDFL